MALTRKSAVLDSRTLTGREKAAIMMLAIGEDNAAKLFQRMDDEEIKEMSQNMAHLGTIPAPLVEAIFIEFSARLSSTGALVGRYGSTEHMQERTSAW